jgi:tRNA pseudouridine38-40 synthase
MGLMRNLKMVIEYDGTDFFGWQYQPNRRTVQGEIQAGLSKVTNEIIKIIGAGRTDQGVHALGQVANFHTSSQLELRKVMKSINSLTGEDIYVKNVYEVEDNFNSRYSAKTKLYQYHIVSEPFPLKIRYNWFVEYKLNISEMRKSIPYLLGEHDFRYFSAEDDKEDKVCKIYDMSLTTHNTHIIIKIEGNRFLRKMARGIIGFICDIGRGRFSPSDVYDVFKGKIKEIYLAPPHGLFLMEVRY